MQLLNAHDSADNNYHLIAVFGLGLIGTSILNELLYHGCELLPSIELKWDNSESRFEAFRALANELQGEFSGRFSIVWSAGICAFHSTEADVNQEHQPFMDLIRYAQNLRSTHPHIELCIHYVSSAGGLFEGQRIVIGNSLPSPVRPYGRLKLKQENILLDSFDHRGIVIYRPSSVYGAMQQKARKGLINNLVNNALAKKTTVLDANVMALRDYVFAGDIGGFIAKKVLSETSKSNTNPFNFLVSARCTSLFEVVRIIERVLNVTLQLRYDESFGNSSNITFSSNILPDNWRASSLGVGVRQFLVSRDQLHKTHSHKQL